MCGAPLGPPPPPASPEVGRERARVPVSGPSFLGLGDERSRDLDYLLEDEPPRGHARLYLALLLLVASGALLAWQWQRDGYPWSSFVLKPAMSSPAPVSSLPVPAPESAAAAAPVPVEPTANPAPPEAQAAGSQVAPPPAAGTATSAAPDNPSAVAKPADQTSQPAAAKPAEEAAQPIDSSDSSEAAAKTPVAVPQPTSEPETAAARRETRTASALPGPKSVGPKPSPPAPPDSFEDRLVADGEKYLYGRGVPEDCERAQRNLQIGARQSNARAQTLLGAMYATGHCVNRDLPTAYRWFAKALHGDPGNSRVQRDLEVLWKQMTPEERQLAMKSQ